MSSPKTKTGVVSQRLPPTDRQSTKHRTANRPSVGERDATKSSMLHIRLDGSLKADATKTLDEIGISLPEAIRVFLRRVVREGAFPFPLHVPNAETAAALRESMASFPEPFESAEDMFDALEKDGRR